MDEIVELVGKFSGASYSPHSSYPQTLDSERARVTSLRNSVVTSSGREGG